MIRWGWDGFGGGRKLGVIEFIEGFPAAGSARRAWEAVRARRAVEAYRFFYPTVSMEGIFRGNRDAGAVDSESATMVIAQPHHLGFTLNSDTPYAAGVLDLRETGPVVVDVPHWSGW